jgi:hypothetical protein
MRVINPDVYIAAAAQVGGGIALQAMVAMAVQFKSVEARAWEENPTLTSEA